MNNFINLTNKHFVAKDKENLSSLFTQKPRERFRLQDGLLVAMTRWEHCHYSFDRKYRDKVEGEVKEVVSDLLKKIDSAAANGEFSKSELQELFFQKFSKISHSIFDRKELLNTHILKTLNSNYNENATSWKDVKRNAKVSIKLGVKPEFVESGTNGTYFIKDLSDKKIAVFKPGDEECLSENTPKTFSKVKRVFARWVPIFKTLIYCVSGNGCHSEAAASIVNQELDLKIVPETNLTHLPDTYFQNPSGKKKEGSLQLFVSEKRKLADEKLKISKLWLFFPHISRWLLKHRSKEPKVDQFDYEKMAILDFVIGNIDRHYGNFFVLKGKKLICFDNGNAFPEKHSGSWVSKLNQYAWGLLPQAETQFSPEARELIKSLREKQGSMIERLKQNNFLNEEQEKAMRERIEVLIKMRKSTPYKLSKIKTDRDIKKILTKQ